MKCIIIGCGKVGTTLAEQLCQEQAYLFEGAKPLPYAPGTGVGSLPSSDTVLRSAFGLARETE